jgi:hypothetical protein
MSDGCTSGIDHPVELAVELWGIANDMRDLEDDSFKTRRERLNQYRTIRAELEKALSEFEDRDLPQDHRARSVESGVDQSEDSNE